MNYKLKINVKKIDKAKLFTSEKTGAVYLDCFVIETPNNQYGDSHMVVQSTTKEEREAGVKGEILGNMKESKPVQQQAADDTAKPPVKEDGTTDSLPF